jgi:predicted O-methyltransferase YrrM
MNRWVCVMAGVAAGAILSWIGGARVGSEEAGKADAKSRAARLEFIRNFKRTGLDTTIGDGALLRILVTASKAKRGVEVGSYKGFGAINMGMAFEQNGGRLFTLEIDPKIAEECRENIKKVDLEETVSVVVGDALKTLPELEGEFDFVFIDALKQDYLKYLKAIEPKLKPGAVVVADNTIRSAGQMRDFLDHVEKGGGYDAVTVRASLDKNDGMTIAVKLR